MESLMRRQRGSRSRRSFREYREQRLRHRLAAIGLDPALFGTHSLRRTKTSLIYKRTGNLRAVQILLGHRKIESMVRYLGVDLEDALALSENTDV